MSKSYSTIQNNQLIFKNQEIQNDFKVKFHQTLRVPDNRTIHSLPPNLGNFPLYHVEDYPLLPKSWQSHGGIFLPMHQSEAMWISFQSRMPYAVKIAAGKINAITGEKWTPELKNKDKEYSSQNYMDEYLARSHNMSRKVKNHIQDYFIVPEQPWIDGFNVGEGIIRQFVAAQLGEGLTVEEQLNAASDPLVGGIQIIAYPMKKEVWNAILATRVPNNPLRGFSFSSTAVTMSLNSTPEMGIGAGGMITQEIYEDKYGLDVWDMENPTKVFVHILNAEHFEYVTKEKLLTKAPNEDIYLAHNYPWFNYYKSQSSLAGSAKLSHIKSVNSLKTVKDKSW